ncbi:MAG: chromosome segregation protein SMC [Actinomycetota bacterium]|nr:chromosome segregation protein SMC [Actinomycetota bacterium]
MFLKSLVLRGFKSFADKTTLVFEPGITIVVGPNGSGKSNIVDAISWVLGEQGPRSLRGGKMEDVIFAGSRLRPALGMAEVSLTIDNSAGALPIDFSEVTISRILFRSGDSEYRLNGSPCRLLDIQEVLSDTGIGREQHTIIGQGQLDAVLSADPTQMRGFIEEAAGVAKHRRRKDRALRKIASTEQNLLRLSDLLAEIRRMLRPLREQAEVAKRHLAMADELDRLKLIAATRELKGVRELLGSGEAIDLETTMHSKETELTAIEEQLEILEDRRSEVFARSEAERDAAWSLTRDTERLVALGRLATERRRTLEAEIAVTTEDAANARVFEVERQITEAEHLLAQAMKARDSQLSILQERKNAAGMALAGLRSVEVSLAEIRSDHKDAAAQIGGIRGDLAALSASRDSALREVERLAHASANLESSSQETRARFEQEIERLDGLEADESPLSEQMQQVQERIRDITSAIAEQQDELLELERESARWRAKAEVRSASSPASAARVMALAIDGVIGTLGDLITVPSGFERAVEALVGKPESVIVVDGPEALRDVISAAGDQAVSVIVAGGSRHSLAGVTAFVDVLESSRPEAARALSDIYIVDDISEASRLAAQHPQAVFLTRHGAVAIGRFVSQGPTDVVKKANEVEDLVRQAAERLEVTKHDLAEAQGEAKALSIRLNETDATLAAAAERISGIEREVHALDRELGAIQGSKLQAEANLSAIEDRARQVNLTLPQVEKLIESKEASLSKVQEEQGRMKATLEVTEAARDEARLACGVAEERVRLLVDRKSELTRALVSARDSASNLSVVRDGLIARGALVESIESDAASFEVAALRWAGEAEERYRASRQTLVDIDRQIAEVRTDRIAMSGALSDMRQRAREEDLGRSELRIRSRIIEEKMTQDWSVEPDSMVERYGHRWEIEDPSTLEDLLDKVAAMDDDAIAKRSARLERDLSALGRVNPLAAQEYEELTQRESFLAAQIADVRASRRDLFKVVSSVEEEIVESFGRAFEDVSREYERLFAMLFPGGQGRLRLTDPTDLLMTGVEIEARPGGKNLKRLSLLSGGERALSALAVLFAIFKARPSPFYVLDEVEAALDDVNLHRFLGLLAGFRDSSQLLVVSHQKRTMEAADILYGVSIKPDGASRVISQRLSETTPSVTDIRSRIQTDS